MSAYDDETARAVRAVEANARERQQLLDRIYVERFGEGAIAPTVQRATLPTDPAPADSTTPPTNGAPQ